MGVESTFVCETAAADKPDLDGSTMEEPETFSLADMDWIGFDLDHTLVRYNLDELLPLIYRCVCDVLVARGVASSVLDVAYDADFCARGLVFDTSTGDLLKLDSDGRVCRACHGYCPSSESAAAALLSSNAAPRSVGHFLTDSEIRERYGDVPWRGLEEHWQRGSSWLTPSCSPLCQVAAMLVSEVDCKVEMCGSDAAQAEAGTYASVLRDIEAAHHDCLKWTLCAMRQGGYYPQVLADPSRFVPRRDHVRAWLEKLRNVNGKRLFLLTNSHLDYSDVVMSEAYGADWRDMFDIIIYRGMKKSKFFTSCRPFKLPAPPSQACSPSPGVASDQGSEEPLSPIPGRGRRLRDVLAEGRREFLEGNARELSACFGDESSVLYFGDDLNGDIAVPHSHSGWRTAAVVEELAQPTSPTSAWGPIFSASLDGLSGCFDAEEESERSDASYLLESLAYTADLTIPDLAKMSALDIEHRFELRSVLVGMP
eukprot:TRINITY_DN23348_c0_g2_i1.p1 TRINITY_DN23348_c0_g2~~TRINITY_DN23348_c0_g2_i1.p1  ORF type:complete len:490 (+),score=74.38 TRINITY_DN23348_c0_g2_i1:26-1471(+)